MSELVSLTGGKARTSIIGQNLEKVKTLYVAFPDFAEFALKCPSDAKNRGF